MIKAGVIGAGHLGKIHLHLLKSSKFYDLVGFYDSDRKNAEILNKEKLYSKKLEAKIIENILKKNFSITWRWFYRMQIPMIIGYHDMFEDLTTFHVWGTVCMNQAFNYTSTLDKKNGSNQTREYLSLIHI